MKFIQNYLIPYKNSDPKITSQLLKAFGIIGLSKLCFLGIPMSLKEGINSLQDASTMHQGMYYFLAYGIFSSFLVYFDGKRAVKIQEISLQAWREISSTTFKHILNLDANFHFKSSQKSRTFTIYKAHQSINNNIKLLLNYLVPLVLDLMITCSYMYMVFGWNYLFTFIATAGIYAKFTSWVNNKRVPELKLAKQMDKKADNILSESLANFYTIKHFNQENFEIKKYDNVLQKYIGYTLKNQSSLGLLNFGQRFIFTGGMTLNLLQAVKQVQKGLLTVGDLVFLQSLMLQIMQPLFFLGQLKRDYKDSLIEIKELLILLDKIPQVKDAENAKQIKITQGDVEFENVSFGYEDKEMIVQDFSIKIQRNSFVSIVGESGVGKSSILNLIYRFYDPCQGRILIDGCDIKQVTLDSLRSQLSVVSQHTYLYNDTIMSNLKYANQNKSDEEIIDVCKQLNLHDFIMLLPEQYQTKVGEQGSQLSGGERQRLAVARCLLKDAPIILLDEATASLDAQNEKNVIDILSKQKLTKTIIMITHRLNLNQYVDEVFMLKKNQSIEQGAHQELIKNQESSYYKLWKQFVEDEKIKK